MRLIWSGMTALLACFFVLQVPAGPLAAPGLAPRGAAAGAPQDSGEFTLAVLRRDGIVVPFAHYNGRRWSNPWPVAGKRFEIPLTMQDIPDGWWPRDEPVTAWTAWPRQGKATRIESGAPVEIRAHCQRGLGIRTTYKPAEAPPPDMVQPYPKDGLAVAGSIAVEPTDEIPASAQEWKAVLSAVEREVNKLEERAVSGMAGSSSWRHPATRQEREDTPLTPEIVLRVSDRAMYFEGVKTYPPPITLTPLPNGLRVNRSGTCSILTYAAGWVLLDDSGKPEVKAGADVTDCNREGMVYTLPLGKIRRGDTTFWVTQVSGYGYERYEVLEVREDNVKSAIATPGGWCW